MINIFITLANFITLHCHTKKHIMVHRKRVPSCCGVLMIMYCCHGVRRSNNVSLEGRDAGGKQRTLREDSLPIDIDELNGGQRSRLSMSHFN